MELFFEILNSKQFVPATHSQKTFKAGGVIGRGADCDWVIPDRERHLSNHHALVTYSERAFYLTDISSNGILHRATGQRLPKDNAIRIENGGLYVLGDFEIQARLISLTAEPGCGLSVDKIIPDDAFLNPDPLVDFEEHAYSKNDELFSLAQPVTDPYQRADYARIDTESLIVPNLIDAPKDPQPAIPASLSEPQLDEFWQKFARTLGLDLAGLDQGAKEELALKAALLLKQSVDGLQQSLRTRSELKNELRLSQSSLNRAQQNPLQYAADSSEALSVLLQSGQTSRAIAEQAISRAFRDLQAHQVALVTASRAAVRSSLEHFSPEQLTLRFERDNKPLIATSGSRWRAYSRYHHALRHDNEWTERILARDFAQAYEEQLRLISTLHIDYQG